VAVPDGVTLLGLMEHMLEPSDESVQETATARGNPVAEPRLMVALPVPPLVRDKVVGLTDS
jgi:hypothetical protein